MSSFFQSNRQGGVVMRYNHKDVFDRVSTLKKLGPLVHNVTNLVSMQNIANILLAIGAPPLMAHAQQELKDILSIPHSKALVLNIGTLDEQWIKSFQAAQELAVVKKIPVILDPVGAGASNLRTETALQILSRGVSVVRGNASEIMALVDRNIVTKGVETTAESHSAENIARHISKQYSCVVVVSGRIDIIVNGDQIFYVEKPEKTFLTKVTGMGCAITSVIGGFAAAAKHEFEARKEMTNESTSPEILREIFFYAACDAMITFAVASEEAMHNTDGPGSFFSKLLDNLNGIKQLNYRLLRQLTDNRFEVISVASQLVNENALKAPASSDYYSVQLVADWDYTAKNLIPNYDSIEGQEARNRAVINRLFDLIKDSVEGGRGVTCVLLRAKTAPKKYIIEACYQLIAYLKPLGIPFMVNDFVDVAKITGADGVHVGQNDMPVVYARRELGRDKIIGLSITNLENARIGAIEDADYYVVGPIYPTVSKPDADPVIGLEGLINIRRIIANKPIIVIGGVKRENAAQLIEAKADGVSVIGAIMGAASPREAAEALNDIVHKRRQSPLASRLNITATKAPVLKPSVLYPSDKQVLGRKHFSTSSSWGPSFIDSFRKPIVPECQYLQSKSSTALFFGVRNPNRLISFHSVGKVISTILRFKH
jgi:hydroxyethylthiazole kinase